MSCAVQNPPSVQFLVNATAPSNPMDLVFPYVIFWNPLAQFPLSHGSTYGGNGQGGRGATSGYSKEGGAEWLSVFGFF